MTIVAVCTGATAFAAEPPPLEIYGRLPEFEMAALSPSGDHIAVLATVGGKRRVMVLDAALKLKFQAPISATAKFRGISWAGDMAVLIDYSVTADLGVEFTTAKAELDTVLVLPLDGSKAWVLFKGDEDVTGGVWDNYGVVERNGRWFGYFGAVTLVSDGPGTERRLPVPFNPDLYEVDLQSHHHRIIARKTPGEHDERTWLIDDKGDIGATLNVVASTGQWTLTNGKGARLAGGVDKSGNVAMIAFTPDGSGVIYRLRDAEKVSWFSVPLVGGAPVPFLDGMTVARWFQGAGHRMIGYSEDNVASAGHFFDVRNDKVYRGSQRAFPGERMVLKDANRAFNRLLVMTEGPGDPETWWFIDIASGHADPVGYSYSLQRDQVGPVRMVAYTAADGLKMEGVLTLPPDRPAKALPAVILPHGGPSSYDTVKFDWIAQAFASRGYAVFQPNFRASTGYGVAFMDAGNGEWGRKMQTDISDGLAELVRQGVVDPQRVCIVGGSYGGYAALAGVTLQHGIYRCAVAIAGIGNLARMVSDDNNASAGDPMLARSLKREIGSGRDLKAVSPVRFADKVDVPVMLIHGKDDTVVNFNQSTEMADALRRAGKTVEFVTLKNEDHWLSKSETRLLMLQSATDFVIRNNPPDAPPAAKSP